MVGHKRLTQFNGLLRSVSAVAIYTDPDAFTKGIAQGTNSLDVFLNPRAHLYFHVGDSLLDQLSDSGRQFGGRLDANHSNDFHIRTNRAAPKRVTRQIGQ